MTKSRPKQFADRDLHTQLRFPTLSWSSISAWGYDKETWYRSYVLGERSKPNSVMQGGIDVGERIVSDSTFLKEITRPEIFEHNLTANILGMTITGHMDGWSPSIPEIQEYKTTQNKFRWTQEKVDEWGQISFYCLLVYIHYKIPPEKLSLCLWSIPMIETGHFEVIQKGTPQKFSTKRTMVQILNFAKEMKQIHTEMLAFVEAKQLSTS